MHFLCHIPHMTIQAMQCNVIQAVIHMFMATLAQAIKLIFQFVSFYEWVFMYMYLKNNNKYCCLMVDVDFLSI